jgi:hypothetical protein
MTHQLVSDFCAKKVIAYDRRKTVTSISLVTEDISRREPDLPYLSAAQILEWCKQHSTFRS